MTIPRQKESKQWPKSQQAGGMPWATGDPVIKQNSTQEEHSGVPGCRWGTKRAASGQGCTLPRSVAARAGSLLPALRYLHITFDVRPKSPVVRGDTQKPLRKVMDYGGGESMEHPLFLQPVRGPVVVIVGRNVYRRRRPS